MSELQAKARKAKYRLKHDFFTPQKILLASIAFLCLIWTWGSVSALSRNWLLAQEVMERQREKLRLELEVETLELENEYYLSEEYEELAARRYHGKKLPGETVVYLPANSEAARTKHQDDTENKNPTSVDEMSNFQQWMTFLFGS